MDRSKTSDKRKIQPLQVNVRLTGEDAERFRRYKEKQKLKTVASATYKLLLERLDQVEPAAA